MHEPSDFIHKAVTLVQKIEFRPETIHWCEIFIVIKIYSKSRIAFNEWNFFVLKT